MQSGKSVPQLAGQWINLVPLGKPPIQLPNRPEQQIDSYSTIWQKGNKLWSGDSSGSVSSDNIVSLYGQNAHYKDGEIIWKKGPLHADVRTVDVAGMWIDEHSNLHGIAQKSSPVVLTKKEKILGEKFTGSITGHDIRITKNDGASLTGLLSQDSFSLTWSNGSIWKRHLHVQGHWVSVMDTNFHEVIQVDGDNVSIGGIEGKVDLSIWYLRAVKTPFPCNKKEGGIDFDCTAIHWYDYVGWLRIFLMEGSWMDNQGKIHTISDYKIKDPGIKSRFTWRYNVSSDESEFISGEMIRNWIELDITAGEKLHGIVDYESNRIDWENGDTWLKQKRQLS